MIHETHTLAFSAAHFAAGAHAGQQRKYTFEPYVDHPIEVARIVASVPHTDVMLAAAYLHDVVEDTERTSEDIRTHFGPEVADLVDWLTNVSKPSHGNRKIRKAIDRHHSALAPAEAQTIKVADMLSNVPSIVKHDPEFAKVYVAEKRKLLAVLTKADPTLWGRAFDMLMETGL